MARRAGEPKSFVSGRVWQYLRNHPGARGRDVATAVGHGRSKISTLLNRLKSTGYTRNGGHKGAFTQWYAVGKLCPADNRGSAVNSLKNLRLAKTDRLERLSMANKAKGVDVVFGRRKKERKPNPFPLQECWKLPLSSTQTSGD